jgi:acetylornithine/succinyldiaminopimelate/putrescine aminotransferase
MIFVVLIFFLHIAALYNSGAEAVDTATKEIKF